MNIRIRSFTGLVSPVVVAAIFAFTDSAHGGWTGAMNGTGYGWSGVSVTPATGLQVGSIGSIRTANMTSPSAAMSPAGYAVNSELPKGSSVNTVARIKGSSGYIWQANTAGSNGDKTDNYELEHRVVVRPASCASLTMESTLTPFSFDPDTGSGSISVKTVGTAGTALLLRGFEVPPGTVVPEDDLTTLDKNETIEFLKEHGVLKFENLMVGPFEYGSNGQCDLIIHFTLDVPDTENFIFTTDGLAKSLPITITCPEAPPAVCGEAYRYPDAAIAGGCGNVAVTYNPDESGLHLGLNTVLVTATDAKGDSGTCTFTVNMVDSKKPVISGCPSNIRVNSSATACGQIVNWAEPSALDECGATTVLRSHAPGTFFPVGTTTVTYKFSDSTGNNDTCSFTVTVEDKAAPVPPALPDVNGSCGIPVTLSPPVAVDNCSGNVAGTTTTVFPITQPGTTTVVWTFKDAQGNTSTASQKVNIAGYQFAGFYSPIGVAPGGTCDNPAKEVRGGSSLPIKFDFKCGGAFITSGPKPVVKIQKWSNSCGFVSEQIFNADYQNDWHVNWDPPSGKGLYQIIVVLPDNSTYGVFIKTK